MTQTTNNSEPSIATRASSFSARLQPITQRIPLCLTLCIILFIVAMCFNLYRLGVPGIWFDEAFSVELARQPFPLLWHIIFGPEPNMELYYLFLHFWLNLTASLGLHATEFVVRLPSAVFAALSTVVIFLLGQRFIGTSAGFVGAGLYLLNDLQLVYAQQTRAYSLQLLLICIAWYALLAAFNSRSRPGRWWVCYSVATTLAIYTHLFSALILLAQLCAIGLLLLLPGERRRMMGQLRNFIGSLVFIGILSLPMALVSRHGSKTGWLSIPHPHDIYQLFLTISANSTIYLLLFFAFCALGLFMTIIYALPAGRTYLKRYEFVTEKHTLEGFLPIALALLCWLVVPIVASYGISQTPTRLFSSRYLVTIVPPLCLLVGLGIATLRWRAIQAGLIVILLLLAVRYVPLYYQNAQVEDWNSAAHWLEQHYQTNDGLVCYDNDVQQGCQISVEYYLQAYPTAAQFTTDSPGAFSWANFGPVDPKAGSGAAVDPTALAQYGAKHPRIFFIVGRVPDAASAAREKAAQQWLDSHYHFVNQIVTRTVTVRLYTT
ncbi:MAG: glycosyltransferase family 39 protein [Ktedonobacteraceae bacterium]|nr:glycosyltransferase family 39 protein [Ktedonobacteraceae bacterium]